MKRIIDRLGKLIRGKRVYAILMLGATIAFALAWKAPVWAASFKSMHSFDSADGANPVAGLIQASDHELYGTTSTGGSIGEGGTVFEITPTTGTLTTLHNFCSSTIGNRYCVDGNDPQGSLVQASNGDLYGTAQFGGQDFDGTLFGINHGGTLR